MWQHRRMSASPTPSAERFVRLDVLGTGSMGEVYRALDRRYGTEVALKRLRLDDARRGELKQEFRRVSRVLHPNVAAPYDLVVDEEAAFFTMELIQGEPVDPTAPWSPQETRRLALQIARGLEAVHDVDLVHRDVKPENILVDPAGRAVLLDFDLAWAAPDPAAGFCGTWSYIAPELVRGGLPTSAADLFALGVVLFEVGTGRRWERRSFDHLPDPAELDPQRIDPELAALVTGCLDPDPHARPTATKLCDALGLQTPEVLETPAVLVGRDEELSWLEGCLARGESCRVEGAPGIGKSTLLDVLAAAPGIRIARCRLEESVPYNAFDRLITELALDAPRQGLQALAACFPDHGLPRSTSGRPRLEEIASDLAELAGSVAEALVFDDLQWADADSLSLLGALLAQPSCPPILIGHRADPTLWKNGLPDWLAALPVQTLMPLEGPHARELATLLVGDDAEALTTCCAGAPLLMTRLARRWRTGKRELVGVEQLVWEDIEGSGPASDTLVTRAALHHGPIPVRILVHGVAVDDPRAPLRQLVRRGVLTFANSTTLAVAHDTTRDAVLVRLQEPEATHHALAEAYVAVAPDAHAEIALHRLGSGRPDLARGPALLAAHAAAASFAWRRACRFYALALDGAEAPAEDLRSWSRALVASGDSRGAAAVLEKSTALADQVRRAELLATCGEFERADDLLERITRHHHVRLPQAPALRMLSGLYNTHRRRSRGLTLASYPDPAARDRFDALWSVVGSLGQFDGLRTFALQGQCTVAGLDSGDPLRAARALVVEASFLDIQSVPTDEIAVLDDAIARFLDQADASELDRAYVQVVRSYRDFCRGRLERALAGQRAAEATFARRGELSWQRSLGWNYEVLTLSHLGRYAEARRSYREVLARHLEVDDQGSAAVLELGFGVREALLADDVPRARERLRRAQTRLPSPLPTNLAFMRVQDEALIAWYAGDPAEAHRIVATSWGSLRSMLGFSVPFGVLWYLWAATGDDAGVLSDRQLARAIDVLGGNDGPWIQAVRADLLIRLARRRREALPLDRALERAREAAMQGAVVALEARRDGFWPEVEGVVRPERYLVSFGW